MGDTDTEAVHTFCCKFLAKSNGERIEKIDRRKAK